jgi:hypothetical protein
MGLGDFLSSRNREIYTVESHCLRVLILILGRRGSRNQDFCPKRGSRGPASALLRAEAAAGAAAQKLQLLQARARVEEQAAERMEVIALKAAEGRGRARRRGASHAAAWAAAQGDEKEKRERGSIIFFSPTRVN